LNARCPYEDCVTYHDPRGIEGHKQQCRFKQTKECEWCFKMIAMSEIEAHVLRCIGRPRTADRVRTGTGDADYY
jgi:hypothetical protein